MNRSAQPGISSTVGGVSLKTSGFVDNGTLVPTVWSDLLPFEQGYVEAMFASLEQHPGIAPMLRREGTPEIEVVGFSDLAPETLAAIRKDCARYQKFNLPHPRAVEEASRAVGSLFWHTRQSGKLSSPKLFGGWDGFPPLTPILGDDAKVRFQ